MKSEPPKTNEAARASTTVTLPPFLSPGLRPVHEPAGTAREPTGRSLAARQRDVVDIGLQGRGERDEDLDAERRASRRGGARRHELPPAAVSDRRRRPSANDCAAAALAEPQLHRATGGSPDPDSRAVDRAGGRRRDGVRRIVERGVARVRSGRAPPSTSRRERRSSVRTSVVRCCPSLQPARPVSKPGLATSGRAAGVVEAAAGAEAEAAAVSRPPRRTTCSRPSGSTRRPPRTPSRERTSARSDRSCSSADRAHRS